MRGNLKKARENAGLKQFQVAQVVGCSLRMYQHLETGDRDGNFKIWDALEDLFQTSQRKLRENTK